MSDTQPTPKPKSLMEQFMEFLKTFGIIGLAIAFVIGAASSKLITAFVNDLVNPLVGLALPSGSLKELSYSVTNSVTGVTSIFAYGANACLNCSGNSVGTSLLSPSNGVFTT